MPKHHPPELGKLFEELAALHHFSPEEEKRLSTPLKGAIVFKVMKQLFESLPEDQKKIFAEQTFKDSEAIMVFLKKIIPEKVIGETVAKVTEEMIK